jgi:hypothetical protein
MIQISKIKKHNQQPINTNMRKYSLLWCNPTFKWIWSQYDPSLRIVLRDGQLLNYQINTHLFQKSIHGAWKKEKQE